MTFHDELDHLFSTPPAKFGPTPLWWWSGERVTRERVEWQLRRFHDGGIDNLVVINLAPAGPLFGAASDDPQWFSDEWWGRFEEACVLAKSLGMRLWFYDQIGFSGANIQGRITRDHPDAVGQTLRSVNATVSGGRVVCSPGGEPVAAYIRAGDRHDIGLDGTVDCADGEDLLVVSAHPTAFDYLDHQAVSRLLDTVHGEFERRLPQYLGNVIAGSFQDELPSTNAWTPGLPEQFRRRMGYDLLDHLPALFDRGGLIEAKVRTDYYAVRAQLTEETLFQPLARWHADHHMLLGADQSNPARAGVPLQSTQIYTDYWRTHRRYSAVGSDHEGDSKVHSSMAHLYGHERVWLEAFHSSGWGGTLEDTWDWLLPFLRSGATLYNPHATYYSTVGGWFEWAPPSTDWRQPYWQQYPAFSRAVARVASLMSWGTYEADVAVLHPTTTMQAALPIDLPIDHFLSSSLGPDFADVQATQDSYVALCGTNDWFRSRPGLLDRHGISFDVIDDASVQRANSANGRLRVTNQAYRTVVLPSATFLEEGTAHALLALMETGGRVVVVGEAPQHAAGRAGDDAVVAQVLEHAGCVRVDAPDDALGELHPDEQYARSDTALLIRRSGDTSIALVGGAFPNASAYPLRPEPGSQRRSDNDFDRSRYADEQTVQVRAHVVEAEVWDPARGTRLPAAVMHTEEGSTLTVRTGGAPMVLLVWRDGDRDSSTPPVPAAAPAPERIDVSTGWTGELVPTLDNRWGDLARPAGRSLENLQIWTVSAQEVAAREADSGWAETKVTHGQRLLVHPPTVDLPAPLDPKRCTAVADGAELGGPGWTRQEYSASRGLIRDHVGALGTKGAVPTDFVITADPAPGEQTAVRTILLTEHRGSADLIIETSSDVVAWWNGSQLELPTDVHTKSVPVTVERYANILEYRVGPSRTVDQMDGPRTARSSFTLAASGGYTKRPEYMVFGDPHTTPDGLVVFRTPVPTVAGLRKARLVVGTASAATVVVNGRAVARQEKVEYYESQWGANPAFFSHEIARHLTGVDDILEVRLATTDIRDVVYVDLALVGDTDIATVVSGAGWECITAGRTSRSAATPRQWGPIESAHAIRRPHPLPSADWLRGAPEIGDPVLAFGVTDSTTPLAQAFRIDLPAGSRTVRLPLCVDAELELDGRPVFRSDDGVVSLPAALTAPAPLTVMTVPTVDHRGGAAWSGPIEVRHERAPIVLDDWRTIGLAAWSGGVRYRRTVDVPAGRRWSLDLGDLRGSVEICVAGEKVGEAFCAPFRFDLQPVGGPVEVEVTVFNTLGPFLHESTPTTWVFPSQLGSGLFGPVTVLLEPT